jgi:uncharacterized cofD-like protein
MTQQLHASLKWLYPGMHVKRWIALGFCGLAIFLVGLGVRIQARPPGVQPFSVRIADWVIAHTPLRMSPGTLGLFLTGLGIVLCMVALARLVHSLTSVLDPDHTVGSLAELIYQKRKLTQGRRIVVVGGGTGLSTMLRGLKQYTANITAVVTVADDGGSSGKIKKQLNILPPGDIRNCLVALADSEPQMTELFQFRFRKTASLETVQGQMEAGGAEAGMDYGEGLRDHAFGNLLIAAMCAINGGDFEKAVRETSRVLNIRGSVLPSTVENVRLRGEMEDGSILEGETTIASSPLKIKRVELVPPAPCPVEEVLEAIAKADIIVLGPGSVFTSIIPNLLVQGIPEAIRRSKARKVYACNVMTQPGETDGFTAYDHIKAIENHARLRLFDYVLVNTQQPNQALMEKYRKSGAMLVVADTDRIRAEGYRPITGNFISETDVVRHDANLLAKAIMNLLH